MPISPQRALKNAIASTRMEGFRITPEMERNAKRILDGKISVQDCVKEMIAKRASEGQAK